MTEVENHRQQCQLENDPSLTSQLEGSYPSTPPADGCVVRNAGIEPAYPVCNTGANPLS
jgi:hypothetical protein